MNKEKATKEMNHQCYDHMGARNSEAMKKMMTNRVKGQTGPMRKMMDDCGCGCGPLEQNRE